jgi:hypothetical protein
VHDPGDFVSGADGAECFKVADIGLLGENGQASEGGRHLTGAASDDHALLAKISQSADGVGPDEA